MSNEMSPDVKAVLSAAIRARADHARSSGDAETHALFAELATLIEQADHTDMCRVMDEFIARAYWHRRQGAAS